MSKKKIKGFISKSKSVTKSSNVTKAIKPKKNTKKTSVKIRIGLERQKADSVKTPTALAHTYEVRSNINFEMPEKTGEEIKKERKKFNRFLLFGMLLGCAFVETLSFITTGRSYFIATANQGAESIRNLNRFQDFFANHPAGQFLESTLEFLSSKPFKRAIRIATCVATLAAATTATGGAFAIAGLAITGVTITVASIKEYISERKIKNQIKINGKLHDLANSIIDSQLKPSKAKLINQFALKDLSSDEKDSQPRKISDMRELFRSFTLNAFESIGSLLPPNINSFVALWGIGALREHQFRTEHNDLKQRIYNGNQTLYEVINNHLGVKDAEKFKYFKNIDQLEESIKKHKFAKEFAQSHQDFSLSDLEASYNKHVAEERQKILETKSRYSTKERINEALNSIASSKFVEPILGYLRSWVPYKKYNPTNEKLALKERQDNLIILHNKNLQTKSYKDRKFINRLKNQSQPKIDRSTSPIKTNRRKLDSAISH